MNNDLISREAAIAAVERREKYLVGDKRVDVESIKNFLANRPAVDAEPVRHGWWEVNMVTDYKAYPAYTYKSGYKCSLCGRRERTNKEPYCHCGAKMDLEEK